MKEIKKILTEELEKSSFKRKSNNWFFKSEELSIVVNIQKSNYSNLYFLNVGIWVNEIGGEIEFPKENKCHLRFRALRILQKNNPEFDFNKILDFELGISREKIENLKFFLVSYFIPFIDKIKSIRLIQKQYEKNLLSSVYLTKEFREVLSSR